MNPNTNNVRRFPRTMQEAFGPHTDNVLYPMPESRQVKRLEPEKPPASNNSVFRRLLIAVTGH